MFSVHEVHDSLFLYTCLRLHFIMTNCLSNMIINPRRACAARVTVVVLCVCLLSVCPARTCAHVVPCWIALLLCLICMYSSSWDDVMQK